MNKTHGLWGIAALAALSMTACGGGDTRYGTDGTMTGGGTSSAPAYDNAYDNGTTNGTTYGNAYDNGTTYGSAYDDGMMTDNYNRTTGNGAYGANGKTYDARDNDGVTDFGDTGRAYDNGNTNRSLLESASDALENGVQRARDGLSTHS